MNTEQVVQALVAPQTGVIFKILDRLQKNEEQASKLETGIGAHIITLEQTMEQCRQVANTHNDRMAALEQKLSALDHQLNELIQRVAVLETAPKAEAPKRVRKKKVEPEPPTIDPNVPLDEPEVPQVEPEVVDPEAPAYEPGLVPDEVAGVPLTGKVVMSIRNNIKVLTLSLAKQLNSEYPDELYDFVAGLSDEEAAAINEKFPG